MTVWHERKTLDLREPRSRTNFKATPKGLAFHWEGSNVEQGGLDASKATIKAIQRTHMANAREGYVDIAYNFAVDHLGNVFELRGWNVQGAANGTTDGNSNYVSIVYLGDPNDALTDAAKQAFRSIRSEADARKIGAANKPHSAFKATQCPGDEIRAFISQLSGGEPVPSPQKPSPAPSPGTPGFPGITRRGSKGDAVKQVQQRLKDRGWNITADGDFGPKTENIVKQFQKEKNVTADGIVGPITWGKLWTAPIS
jgi:hypothetical protein